MSNNCCFECKDRHVGCHAECELYKQYKKDHNRQVKRAKLMQSKYNDYWYK